MQKLAAKGSWDSLVNGDEQQDKEQCDQIWRFIGLWATF